MQVFSYGLRGNPHGGATPFENKYMIITLNRVVIVDFRLKVLVYYPVNIMVH